MACSLCADADGVAMYPMYGVAPHECYWRKGADFQIGQSTLTPISPSDCFVPDLEDDEDWAAFQYPSACGIYFCPCCQKDQYASQWKRLVGRIGEPPAQVIEARQGGDGEAGSIHESAVAESDAP